MSSTVRGSFESNTSSNSNKRKRVPMHPNPSMHQELDDQLLQNQEEEEAAALLNHMHHHADHHRRHLSADRMHIDRGPAQYAPAGDHQLIPRRLPGENSGSSDASAANFSGDSDLTAERPIIGCAADEEGAKSSNSAGSTPFKLPQTAPCTDHTQANFVCQQYSGNLPTQNDIANNKEQASRTSTPPLPPTAVAPSTSTSSQNYEMFPPSEPLSSSQIMQMRAGEQMTMIGCNLSSPACANSVKDSESCWLELSLGFSKEPRYGALPQNYEASTAGLNGRRKSRESLVDATELTPVTLQLLPEKPSTMETCSGAARASMRPSMMVHEPHVSTTGSHVYGSVPPIYQPFSHMEPKYDGGHQQIPRASASGHQQYLLNQSKDPTALLNYLDHQQFLLNQSNDPSPALHQSHGLLPASTGYDSTRRIVYDQVSSYSEFNDRRRWPVTAEMSEMMMIATQPMITDAQQTGVHRPTANPGWPPGTAMGLTGEPRAWSAIPYTTPPQLQGTMSWQGFLRSMATDPLLHTLPELSMRSFDAGKETSAPPGCQTVLPGCTRPPSSRAMTPAPINCQRPRLSTSRRDTGLWFSLQEADHVLNKNGEDHHQDQLLSNQPMQKVYLRIRDGKMQISVIKSYLIRKLNGSSGAQYNNSDEVEITCKGKVLAPTLTIQHVRDTIWLNNDLGEAIGFRYTNGYLSESHKAVMALCYQRHQTQTVTLNLLKT